MERAVLFPSDIYADNIKRRKNKSLCLCLCNVTHFLMIPSASQVHSITLGMHGVTGKERNILRRFLRLNP